MTFQAKIASKDEGPDGDTTQTGREYSVYNIVLALEAGERMKYIIH